MVKFTNRMKLTKDGVNFSCEIYELKYFFKLKKKVGWGKSEQHLRTS